MPPSRGSPQAPEVLCRDLGVVTALPWMGPWVLGEWAMGL